MSAARKYFEAVDDVLNKVRDTQVEAIEQAANLIADALAAGHLLHVFGCSHTSIMTQELVYRAGGLILVNPLFGPGLDLRTRPLPMTSDMERLEGYGELLVKHSRIEAGDVVIVASVSGRNPVPIDVAIAAQARGARLILLTSHAYSSSVSSRHASGKRLFELSHDVILDYCCEPGDAAVALDGLPVRTGGTSTISGVYILNALIVSVVAELLNRGVTPPVFLSGNLDGGDEHNRMLMEAYRDRLTYL